MGVAVPGDAAQVVGVGGDVAGETDGGALLYIHFGRTLDARLLNCEARGIRERKGEV